MYIWPRTPPYLHTHANIHLLLLTRFPLNPLLGTSLRVSDTSMNSVSGGTGRQLNLITTYEGHAVADDGAQCQAQRICFFSSPWDRCGCRRGWVACSENQVE